jgi:hypothetical protein
VNTVDVDVGGFSVKADYGAIAYLDNPTAQAFFGKFQIPLLPAPIPASNLSYTIDFATGTLIPPQPVDQAALNAAMAAWIRKGMEALQAGYLSPTINLPFPLPDNAKDLALPFGKYVVKYKLELIVPVIFSLYAPDDILSVPTIFVMASAGAEQFVAFAQGGFLIPAVKQQGQIVPLGNTLLYQTITKYLGDSAILSGTVSSVCRDKKKGAQLTVKAGSTKVINAKKILLAIPPVLDNLKFMDLDGDEKKVFGKWAYSGSWTSLIANPGLKEGTSITNVSPNNPQNFFLPASPFSHDFRQAAPGTFIVYAVGKTILTKAKAGALINEAVKNVGKAFGTTFDDPTYIGPLADHSPGSLRVSQKCLEDGFLKELQGMQGHRDTWYTGRAWSGDYSTLVWGHAESVVSRMFS